MSVSWSEQEQGLLFRVEAASHDGVTGELERLCLEERAERQAGGVLLPHESVVLLSREEQELLGLPPRNPYRLMLRAHGDLGHSDLRYFVEVLKPDGTPFVRPVFRGCLLHVDGETCYLLNADQYQLVLLAHQSNEHVPQMQRKDVPCYNLVHLAKLQRHARRTAAKLDSVLSEQNNKVIIPEKLDIAFREDAAGEIHIEPVLLTEDDDGGLQAVDSAAFQGKFDRYRTVPDIYRMEDRTRYVCPPAVKQGLEKVKAVRSLSQEEQKRYAEQPRELFPEAVFHFQKKESVDAQESADTDWLPDEGVAFDDGYSERVKGLTEIPKSQYYGSGHKMDWLRTEGEGEEEDAEGIASADAEGATQEGATDPAASDPADDAASVADVQDDASSEAVHGKAADDIFAHPKKTIQALDIKENDEALDYAVEENAREGELADDCLAEGIHLLDYQRQGVAWMFTEWRNGHRGVLLADDMGLGKTLQTLAFIAALRKNDASQHKPVMIVAPIALLKNWQKEYERFIEAGRFRAVVPLHGSALKDFATGEMTPNGKKKLQLHALADMMALTTYETLRDYQFSFAEVAWGIIVVDEAQKMKNPTTGVTKAIKAMKYDYAICLSGTPVENSWIDLWSIMDFVQPGKLKDLRWFKEHYVNRLDDNDVGTILSLGEKLKAELRPLFLRRMKTDKLSGLPQKHIHVCAEQMPEYQKRCYLSVLMAAQQQDLHPLMVIARLRDVSLHPDLSTKRLDAFFQMAPEDIIRQSARLITTFRILDEIRARGEKALIFLVSKKMQAILKYVIEKTYHQELLPAVNGSLNGTARQRIIDAFNASEGFGVLILSPEAAGVGFTITSANNVIHLSRTWNPAKEDQATDRVYRIGQKKAVNVYLPIACHKALGVGGSFDEKLDELLAYKRKLSEHVLFPTGDSQKDGFRLFNDLTQNGVAANTMDTYDWHIEDIDQLNGDAFEEMVADLYGSMEGCQAEKTQHSNDYGVDVVVTKEQSREGWLIQCKHKEDPESSVGKRGVQEVRAAVPYYQKLYPGYAFQAVAITNAQAFSPGARTLAADNGVQLIDRKALKHLLEEHPVLKNC